MMMNGSIVNVWGEVVGRYWWSGGQLHMNWQGYKSNGWTEDGMIRWAMKLGFDLVEDEA